MNDVERLLAIEEVKCLKSRYFYYLDHREWERWRDEVWAENGLLEVPEVLDAPIRGADNIVAWAASRCEHQRSIHHGHMPDIEILSADSARGIWAMEDILRWRDLPSKAQGYSVLQGYGHYHETYIRSDAGWRIQSSRLTRLHVNYY